MTDILVRRRDFNGSPLNINGKNIAIPRDTTFDADAATIEVLSNARVPFRYVTAQGAPTGEILIPDTTGFGGRVPVCINGVTQFLPIGVAFTPPAGVTALLQTAGIAYDTVYGASGSAPTLGTLTLSGTLTNGTPSSGSILGATSGSTIVSNITGLSVNSGARTYTWDGSGSASTYANGLVETLAGATGSPKNNSVTVASGGVSPLNPMSASVAPAAIWSMRKIRTAYAGACLRVANSAGTQTDIGWVTDPAGSGYQVIDQAALIAHSTAGGSNGTLLPKKWYDQSGNGRDLTYASTGTFLKPSTMTRALGGADLPSFDFDGSFSGGFSTSTAIPAGWLNFGGTYNFSMFAIMNVLGPVTSTSGAQPRTYPTNLASFDAVMASTGTNDTDIIACVTESSSGQTIYGKANGRSALAADYPFAKQYPIGLGLSAAPALAFSAARKSTYWFNQKGANVSAGGGGIQSFADRPHGYSAAASKSFILGTRNGARPANSQFSEVILFNHATDQLSDIECQGIDAWTQAFWGAVQTPRVPYRAALTIMGESTAAGLAIQSSTSGEPNNIGDSAWARIFVPKWLEYMGRSYTNTDIVFPDVRSHGLSGSSGLRPSATLDSQMAIVGSSWQGITNGNSTTNFWWDQKYNIPGPCYWLWHKAALEPAYGGAYGQPYINAWQCVITQGINDTEIADTDPTNGITYANWKAAWKSMIALARSDSGKQIQFFFYMFKRPGGDYPLGAKELRFRDLWEEITTELADCSMLPEGGIIELGGDHTHAAAGPANAYGYDQVAHWFARSGAAALGASVSYKGPEIVSAAKTSSTVIDVTITYPAGCAGTDFTPSSGIFGFFVYDNAVLKTISSAIRVNATTIRLTMSAALTGTVTVDYVPNASQDATTDTDDGSRVRDNQNVGGKGMPLRQKKGLVAA